MNKLITFLVFLLPLSLFAQLIQHTQMKQISILLTFLLLFGCILESEHNEVVKENEVLKAELNELKFSIPNLLKDSKKLYELGEYTSAKNKIEILIQKHPQSTETSEAKKMLPVIEEEILFQSIKNSNSLDLIEKYKKEYPKGKYSKQVRVRKREIADKFDFDVFVKAKYQHTIEGYNSYLETFPNGKYKSKAKEGIVEIRKEKKDEAYKRAKNRNTSFAWSSFLKEYPNHWERNKIKDKIISLKVDEIIKDRNTGQLPSFSQTNRGYSSNSSVKIKNDTGHKLTVRYSGPSIKEIVIPRGSSQTTYLNSGSYKIAASANGLHYGGRETLSGNYTSSYYIASSRF